MAITQVSNSLVKQDLTIVGGSVDNTVIGSGTPAAGTFTTIAGTLASTVVGTTAAASDNTTKLATTAYVTTALANLVDSAPGTLNTLNELAAALGDDASFSTTVTTSIATKLPLAGGTMTGDLTIANDSDPTLLIRTATADQANSGKISFREASGGTTGVDLRYNGSTNTFIIDTSDVSNALTITRTTGNSTFGGSVTVNSGNKLIVNRTDNATGGEITYGPSAGTGFTFNDVNGDGIDFKTGSTMLMSIDSTNQRVGIGTSSPDGPLHVHTASAGTVSASSQADDLVIENSTEGGMTIITPDDQSARIRFTSPSTNNDVGGAHIFYRQNINKMNIGTNVSGGTMAILSGAGNETLTLDGSGRVGIGGAPNSNWRNDLSSQCVLMLGTDATLFADSGVTTELWNNAYIDNTDTFKNIAARGATRYFQFQGAHKWFTAASASAGSTISTEINSSPKMVLDISGNLSIGTASAAARLHVDTPTNTPLYLRSSNSGGGYVEYAMGANGAVLGYLGSASQLATGGSSSDLNIRAQGNLTFATGGHNERARIVSDGKILIGKTTTTFANTGIRIDPTNIQITANGASSGYFNRLSNDGLLVEFYQDTAQIGGISCKSDDLVIHSTITNHVGLSFGNTRIEPTNNYGTTSDNTVDLGATDRRFKDIYIAGGIHIGGTGSANKLDDYEEGTWTPTLIAGTTNPTGGSALAPSGTYTKIGNRVWVTFYVGRSWTNSPSGTVYLGNLPFTVHSTSPNYYSANVVTYKITFGNANIPFLIPTGTSNSAALYTAASGGTWSALTWQTHMTSSAGGYISGTLHYVVA